MYSLHKQSFQRYQFLAEEVSKVREDKRYESQYCDCRKENLLLAFRLQKKVLPR